jgi:hypothetical protein
MLQPSPSWSRDEKLDCSPANYFPGGVEVSGFGLDKARLSIECGDHLLKKRGNHFVAVHAEGYRGNHTKDYDR